MSHAISAPLMLATVMTMVAITGVPASARDGIFQILIDRMIEDIDANGDRRISHKEFDSARLSHFDAADRNGDGVVDNAEFTARCIAELGEWGRPWTAQVFQAFDGNADRQLSKGEVARTGDKLFSFADRNGDGMISADEISPRVALVTGN